MINRAFDLSAAALEVVGREDQAEGAGGDPGSSRVDMGFRLVACGDTIDTLSLSHGVRVGLQDLYRAVNERIQGLTAPGGGFDAPGSPNEYVCECGNPNCRTNISLLWQEFAELAGEPGHYLVAAGHLGRDTEVIRRGSDYAVVRWLFETPQPIRPLKRGSSHPSE